MWRILNEERLHNFNFQTKKLFQANDYPTRVEFCQLFLQKIAIDSNFSSRVHFTDKAYFAHEDVDWDNQFLFAATVFTITSFRLREILTFLETLLPSFLNKILAVFHRQM